MNDYEMREELISQLPDLTAAFISENGPIETLPILTGRDEKFQFKIVTEGQRKRPVRARVTAGRKRGGQPGPRPENVEKVRALLGLGLMQKEMAAQAGLTRQTVRTIVNLLLTEGASS